MQQISFEKIDELNNKKAWGHNVDTMLQQALNNICPDCHKNCKNKRGCLITQIQNEINKERKTSFMAINMKLQGISDDDIAYCLSNCKDYKNRKGSFGKCFWGSLKIK